MCIANKTVLDLFIYYDILVREILQSLTALLLLLGLLISLGILLLTTDYKKLKSQFFKNYWYFHFQLCTLKQNFGAYFDLHGLNLFNGLILLFWKLLLPCTNFFKKLFLLLTNIIHMLGQPRLVFFMHFRSWSFKVFSWFDFASFNCSPSLEISVSFWNKKYDIFS